MDVIRLVDPTTGKPRGELAATPAESIPDIVARAREAQQPWADLSLEARKEAWHAISADLRENAAHLVQVLSKETGRPAADIWPGEIVANADLIGHWLANIDLWLHPRSVPFHPLLYVGKRGVVTLQPRGVVGIISPWNLPIALPMRVIVPALLAGNTVVWKPSELSSEVSVALAEILSRHLPEGVLSLVLGARVQGEALVDSVPDALFFTGSVATGRAVAARAAGRIPKLGLELGGNDATLVLPDADLDRAIPGVAWGAFFLAGQNCASIERCYVHEAIAEPFIDGVRAEAEALRLGLDLPPLRTKDLQERVHAHVTDAVEQGAELVCGGAPKEGFFYPPTVLTGVQPDMRLMREETFGPVLPIRVFDDIDAAIAEINDDDFGLTGSVWTRDVAYGEALADSFDVGVFTVNNAAWSGAVPGGTWGGRKSSGTGFVGSELMLYDLVEPKTTIIDAPGPIKKELWWFPYNESLVKTTSSLIEILQPRGRRLQGVSGALTGFINRWKDTK